ncbi:MAG: hydroxyphenylacetyl-CoA thioesterase PaaI [Micromonosporaceae bacterium]|nr:hydroxyphenylacetyl-CoA thioesterase PaaI [Micromonosporaceae bacterium]
MTRAEQIPADDPTCQALGIRTVPGAPGPAVLQMRVTGEMVNRHGIVHGGYLFLLADAAFAHASNAPGPTAVAQSAQITFLRPVLAGVTLWAEATERVRHGRFGVYDVTVRLADGTVVAEFRGHSVVLTGPGSLPTSSNGHLDGGSDGP